jgi:hypothetical protein
LPVSGVYHRHRDPGRAGYVGPMVAADRARPSHCQPGDAGGCGAAVAPGEPSSGRLGHFTRAQLRQAVAVARWSATTRPPSRQACAHRTTTCCRCYTPSVPCTSARRRAAGRCKIIHRYARRLVKNDHGNHHVLAIVRRAFSEQHAIAVSRRAPTPCRPQRRRLSEGQVPRHRWRV